MKLDDNIIKDRLKTNLGLGDAALKIVVVGLGVTGLSVARFLVRLGFEFVIADSREQPPELKQFQMEMPNLTVFTGKFDEDLFNAETYLIVSPGVSLNEHAISKAIASGAKVCGDIDLFACSVDSPVIAITGSNGKSTVTTMLSDMAIAAGKRTGVGGNLGVPALDLSGQDAELYVLELSSFQLERTRCLNAVAATVLNVTADHMDRHENIADYAEQKRKVYNGNGLMVINLDDPIVRAMQVQGRQILTFSIQNKADFWIGKNQDIECLMHGEKPLLPLSELPLEGKHNAANALAA